jgi:hypothetical protein
MSGAQLAESLAWAPSKVSKLENARPAPTNADFRGWTRATNSEHEAEALLVSLHTLEVQYAEWLHWLHPQQRVQHLHAPGSQVPPGQGSPKPLLPARKGGNPMSPVPVAITARPRAEDDDISFIDDVDALGSAEAMLGCGDSNPYN